MTSPETPKQKKLRLWPGIILIVIQIIISYLIPLIAPDRMDISALGGLACCVLILLWWIIFSRAPHFERWGALILIVAAIFITPNFLHESISTGNMGLMFLIYSFPMLCIALVLWAIITRGFPKWPKRITLLILLIFISTGWTLFRSIGIDGNGAATFVWRWTPTPEEQLLANSNNEIKAHHPDSLLIKNGTDWTGFRGNNRDGIVHGVKINIDWKSSPPVELWRRKIGPACSSFAVSGEMLYTQEQRGDDEMVVCYDLLTGTPIWKHSDKARFWDSHAGAGPRATPTLNNGRLYTLGATGIINVLDADSGTSIWSHKAADETKTKSPIWAFSGSPLLTDNLVVIPIAGSLVAYDTATGKQKWVINSANECYSSPQLLTINDTPQILFLNESGLLGIKPTDGKILWQYKWKGNPILQPHVTADGDILVSVSAFEGLRSITINKKGEIKERWTSAFKPNHNDFVVHKGFIYGIDATGLQCVDVKTGERKWKGTRYGGQLLLLADQDILIVLTEKGDVAMVSATPGEFKELARIPAIKGKTWNHPVLAGNILVVRNSEEMTAFRL
jgi:outer membrane protein assembly factor BamB